MTRLKRVNFFSGQLLTAEDFQTEQNYHREKNRRHNRLLHGYGVVSGLAVSLNEENGEWNVIVKPGYALDPAGNEIELCAGVTLRLPDMASIVLVQLRYAEWFTDDIPVVGGGCQPSRVEEGSEVLLAEQSPSESAKTPGDSEPDVVLARLVRTRRGWRIDRRFKVRRAR
jgi:hypothetical protein